MRYGKVVPEFFQGTVALDTSLLSMLIREDKHLQLLGAVQLASTLVAVGAAAVAEGDLDEGSIVVALQMDLDAPIPLRERKCPGVLPRQTPTQLRRMYPVMRSNDEKPLWEFCDRRRLFAVDCRTDGRWDGIACCYGSCLSCVDLLSGKHAAGLNSWMNTAIHPKDTELHYRQGPHVLSRRLDKANDRGYLAQETLGRLQEDVHKFR